MTPQDEPVGDDEYKRIAAEIGWPCAAALEMA